MCNVNEKIHQREVYGQVLDGSESELERSKMARKTYLKEKMRIPLSWKIGDYGDNLADLTRALVLGEAIRRGHVSDKDVIDTFDGYIISLLASYGGPAAIIQILENNLAELNIYLVEKYYGAMAAIKAAENIEEVDLIDIE
jgi:hypothetical protein